MEENQENQEPKSSRGGYRPGSGNKYKWKHGETKAVRIPIAIADEVIELAKAIDTGNRLVPHDSVTQSLCTKGDELSKLQAEIEALKALNSKLSSRVGELETDLIKAHQRLTQASRERDEYFDRISDIELELENLKDDRVTQSREDDSVTQSKLETLEKESRELRYRCSDLEREKLRLEKLGTDYSHGAFITLTEKHQKALDSAKHWEEVAESYRRQAEAIAEKKEETRLEKLEQGRVTQSKIMGIDLEEFYDAVMLKHPPRERKLITKPMQRFKALIAEALTRRGVPVR